MRLTSIVFFSVLQSSQIKTIHEAICFWSCNKTMEISFPSNSESILIATRDLVMKICLIVLQAHLTFSHKTVDHPLFLSNKKYYSPLLEVLKDPIAFLKLFFYVIPSLNSLVTWSAICGKSTVIFVMLFFIVMFTY